MDRLGQYRTIHRFMRSVMIVVFIIGMSMVLFFISKRVSGPKVSVELIDNLGSVKAESVLFDVLDNSFVAAEKINAGNVRRMVRGAGDGFERFEYDPRYEVMVDLNTERPLGARLYNGSEEIPYREVAVRGSLDTSWMLALKWRGLYRFNFSNMKVMAQYNSEVDGGVMMYSSGSIRQMIEVPGGLTRISLDAASRQIFEVPRNFDSSAHMVLNLDDSGLIDDYIRSRDFQPYRVQQYVTHGWHKLIVTFDNDIYDPKNNLDRNLLIKDLLVKVAHTSVVIRSQKGVKDSFPWGLRLSYFRSSDSQSEYELISFFKKRFNEDNLSRFMEKGRHTSVLEGDVDIGGLTKHAIFAPAPSELKFTLKVPQDGIRLCFSYALMEEVWGKRGDGVLFTVSATGPGYPEKSILFSKYIDPKINENDRRWFREDVNLTRFAGKEITLYFETSGGIESPVKKDRDTAYDYAVWG